MLDSIFTGLMHLAVVVFFAGVVGAVVTVLVSWYSIFKDEFTSGK